MKEKQLVRVGPSGLQDGMRMAVMESLLEAANQNSSDVEPCFCSVRKNSKLMLEPAFNKFRVVQNEKIASLKGEHQNNPLPNPHPTLVLG